MWQFSINSLKSNLSQIRSLAAPLASTYSASVDEIATECCNRDHQVIAAHEFIETIPDVERKPVFSAPAWSASLKTANYVCTCNLYRRPTLLVPRKYLLLLDYGTPRPWSRRRVHCQDSAEGP
ncbi:hypothetical protein AVEN_256302-1 [Araneus ventricosus]|uniref:Uncharacterized protein n=1 Tax=Araneus ventricosus TaxID=182803 RepID=A0A4Y2L726_ARAVE|nr:hypothetical protein AVEN_256302-1 [Araneus ventricosus]